MSAEIFNDFVTALRAKGVPFEITYGPPQVPAKVGATRIVLSRDYDAGDQVLGPRGAQRNARQISVRAMGAKVTIFASSTVEGARRQDHELLADQLVDLAHVALHNIALTEQTLWRVTGARYLADATTDGWSGVVYELRFQIDRGVKDVDFVGEAAAEASLDAASAVTTLTTTGSVGSTGLPTATTRVSE